MSRGRSADGAVMAPARRRYRRVLAACALLALLVIGQPAGPGAMAQTPGPPVSALEANAFRNVDVSGDLLFLLRYELPLASWCSELTITDGCSDTPPAPTEPHSLPQGHALVTVYNGSPLVQQSGEQAPRVGHALGGAYFFPGHGITWEDATLTVCIESSATAFSPQSQDCSSPNFVDGSTVAETAPLLGAAVVAMLRNVEFELLEPQGTLVSGDSRVTNNGRDYVIDAVLGLDRVIPDHMQAASVNADVDLNFTPEAGVTALQQSLNTAATSKGVTADLENVAQGYFGMDGTELAAITFMLLAAGAGIWAAAGSGKPVFGLLVGFTVISAGVFVSGPSVQALFSVMAIPVVFAAFWVIKKVSD